MTDPVLGYTCNHTSPQEQPQEGTTSVNRLPITSTHPFHSETSGRTLPCGQTGSLQQAPVSLSGPAENTLKAVNTDYCPGAEAENLGMRLQVGQQGGNMAGGPRGNQSYCQPNRTDHQESWSKVEAGPELQQQQALGAQLVYRTSPRTV